MTAGLDGSQEFCHYPALPPPVDAALAVCEGHSCPYLSGQTARSRALYAESMSAEIYHEFMDANFRRSGKIVYQPICPRCRECRQIRIPTAAFRPSKSQRRCQRQNADLIVELGQPIAEQERFDLYRRYVCQWHGAAEPSWIEYEHFLCESPVDSIEITYRDGSGRLLGVGICDICERSLSSVYFYFDPAEARRRLGTFSILREIQLARELRIPMYYLGFWVQSSPSMNYKADFGPAQALDADGVWRDIPGHPSAIPHRPAHAVPIPASA